MKTILTVLSALLFQLAAYSQDENAAVAFVAYWNVGDAYEFKVTKVKKQWKEGALSKTDSCD